MQILAFKHHMWYTDGCAYTGKQPKIPIHRLNNDLRATKGIIIKDEAGKQTRLQGS